MKNFIPRSSQVPQLTAVALLILCAGLEANLRSWFEAWPGNRAQNAGILGAVLGDGRRLFANHFFVKADAYFHSGFYPTIFDNNEAFKTPHMAEDTGTVAGQNQGDETGFLGKPRDCIDAFSRQFFPSQHTHLGEAGAHGPAEKNVELGGGSEVREILPWLKLSAELNPNDIRTYTVTAYWLRERMGKVAEAEQFLREGLRENPGSYEILFELGRVFEESRHDPDRARNLWQIARHNWQTQEGGKTDPDKFLFIQITSHLARLEEKQGNYTEALGYMQEWKRMSPSPGQVQKRMDEVRERLTGKS